MNLLARLDRPLLLLVLFNLIPQIHLRPPWATILAFVLVSYRLWLDFSKERMPARWVLFLGQGTVVAAIWAHYHTFFGDEAAGTFLTLLLCLKTFELRKKRDYFLVCVLCILVLMSYLLLDQGLMLTAFLLIDVTLIVAFLLALEEERWSWTSWRVNLLPSLSLVSKCIPILAITFFLFPRFTTGFGSNQNESAKMGMTDSLRPGSVAKLILSGDDLIFRATFQEGEAPPLSQLYWRGAVLDQAKGLNWDRSREVERKVLPVTSLQASDVEIYLEPGSERFLFSLPNTKALIFPNENNRVVQREGNIFELLNRLQSREHYFIQRNIQIQREEQPSEKYLQLSEEPSPQMRKFLKSFEHLSTAEIVQKLMNHFASTGYAYSLQPPPADSIDTFLFKTKIGFCEHFASSMATLLRALKVPARVVVGFQGGTSSFLENYVSVRGKDAHAWVEFYDSTTQVWRRVDPTAQVAPLRFSLGSESFFQEDSRFKPAWVPGGWARSYFRTRAFVDEIDARWIGFLIGFDLAKQRGLLAKIGMEEALFRALPIFLFLVLVLVLAILYFIETRKRVPLSGEERLYRQLLSRLRKWDIHKAPNEGPLTLLARSEAIHPELALRITPILETLILARFGGRPLTDQSVDSLRKQIRALKKS